VANNKTQPKAVPSAKSNNKGVLDKKTQVATPSKSNKPATQTGQPKKSRFAFITDIINELKKVVWPSRQEMIRLSLIVIGICLIMGLLLGMIDYGFSELVAKVFLGGK
jgi:preprotein translocase subunit SecE